MSLATLADHGWMGVVLLLVLLCVKQIKMLLMRLVFLVYGTSAKDRNRWLMAEARRNDRMALARGFWNRASKRSTTPITPPRRLPSRRADTSPLTDLSGDARDPQSPAA
jgi:hypothetical protein